MKTLDFVLSQPHVELCQLLKLTGVAHSGGAGKHLIAAGEVGVDRQQQHIDRLERELRALRDQVEAASAATEPAAPKDEIPPHY